VEAFERAVEDVKEVRSTLSFGSTAEEILSRKTSYSSSPSTSSSSSSSEADEEEWEEKVRRIAQK